MAAETPERIVSLAPSVTEALFALGLGDRVVGVTTFCDRPEAALKKPKIGGMSNPSLEEIVFLKPDLVVMTMDGNPKEVEDRLRALGIRTYVWKARKIAELAPAIRELGRTLGVSAEADVLAREIEQGIRKASSGERMVENSELRTPHSALHRKAVFIVWPEPLIVAGRGTAIDDAMTIVGLENIAASAQTTYPRFSIEEVIRQAPEIIFIGKASGMDIRVVSKGILKKLASVPAAQNGNICYISDYLYRLGPRVVPGIEEMAACLE